MSTVYRHTAGGDLVQWATGPAWVASALAGLWRALYPSHAVTIVTTGADS